MTRRCSHCGHNGHNSRTCPNRGVKIFGVRLTDGSSIRKSASMGNLSHYSGTASPPDGTDHAAAADGYASDDFVAGSASSTRDRKKGVPWTEDEHKMFLIGLQKLGKGDWRGIARNYVVSRTPTQVASHAQKYFIRQTNSTRRKRRSSLFDMVPDEAVDGQLTLKCQEQDKHENNSLPAPPAVEEECDSMDSNTNEGEKDAANLGHPPCPYPMMIPSCFPPLFPFPWSYWPGYGARPVENNAHVILKPIAVHSKGPINVNVGMSKLSLGESNGEPTLSLSLKLAGSERQSAFHANPSTSGSNMNSNTSPIHAV